MQYKNPHGVGHEPEEQQGRLERAEAVVHFLFLLGCALFLGLDALLLHHELFQVAISLSRLSRTVACCLQSFRAPAQIMQVAISIDAQGVLQLRNK